jgi:hypothetical protein
MRPKQAHRGAVATPYFGEARPRRTSDDSGGSAEGRTALREYQGRRVSTVSVLPAPTGTGRGPSYTGALTIAARMTSAPAGARHIRTRDDQAPRLGATSSQPSWCLHVEGMLYGQAKEDP